MYGAPSLPAISGLNGIHVCLSHNLNSASAATAAIEQAQWSQTATTSQPSSSTVAANAMAQAQAAGSMGTVTAESYTTQQQTYDTTTKAYQQQVTAHFFSVVDEHDQLQEKRKQTREKITSLCLSVFNSKLKTSLLVECVTTIGSVYC